MAMEVCVGSVISAVNAERGGATRIELCSNLTEGGMTPSFGLLKVVKSKVTIPVFVMIRPRGGDFCYNDSEMSVMREDIKLMKQEGADGFVFGILKEDGSVDCKKCEKLLDEVQPLPATFHRAVDVSKDLRASMSDIVRLGFQRVLTSGGCTSAPEGSNLIAGMVREFGQRIIVIPGGGINASNLESLLKSGVTEFHGSASDCVPSPVEYRHPDICFSSNSQNEYLIRETSSEKVHALVDIANSFCKEVCNECFINDK